MRKPTRSQKNYITGLRLRVPGDHSEHGNVDLMNFTEAVAEIERLKDLEKQASLVTCDWCGDECEADLYPLEDNEGNAIECLPFEHEDKHFCNDFHRNCYQIDNDYPSQGTACQSADTP